MGDFWCYIAFFLGLLGLFVGYAALSQDLVGVLAFGTVLCAVISIIIQSRMTDKNVIAFGLSGVAIAMAVGGLYLEFMGPRHRASGKIDDAMSAMRDLGAAVNRYQLEHQSYPLWGSANQTINFYVIPERSGWQVLPSFRAWALPDDSKKYPLLTTPVAYIASLPRDPFMNPTGATFSYYADQGGWILLSPGPDADFDINPQQAFTSDQPQPGPLLLARQYDPTNGAKSDGDLFLVSAQMQ